MRITEGVNAIGDIDQIPVKEPSSLDAFTSLICELNASDVQYAVLRPSLDTSAQPRPVATEIDLLVHPHDRQQFLSACHQNGFQLARRRIGHMFKQELYRYRDGILQILDVHFAIVNKGLVYLDAELALRRRVFRDDAFYLSPEDQLAHLLCHCIVGKRQIPEKYAPILQQLLSSDYDQLYVERQLDRFGAGEILQFAKEQWQTLKSDPRTCAALRKRVVARLMVRHPMNCVRRVWKRICSRYEKVRGKQGAVVAFLGPDGVGKSTLLCGLNEKLTHLGIKVTTVYMGPFGQSILPVPAFTRIVGPPGSASHRIRLPGIPQLRWFLYLIMFSCEYSARFAFRLYPARRSNRVVMCDRYPYDIAVSYKGCSTTMLHSTRLMVCKLLPRPDCTVVLVANPNIIVGRKQQLSYESAKVLMDGYCSLESELGLTKVDATGSMEDVVEKVFSSIWPSLLCEG